MPLPALEAMLGQIAESGGALAGTAASTASGAAISSFLSPLGRYLEYGANYKWPNAEWDMGTLVQLYFRGWLSEEDFVALAQKWGYDMAHAVGIVRASTQLPPVSSLVEARFRGLIDEDTYMSMMRWHGYTTDAARFLLLVSYTLPDMSSLIEGLFRGVISESDFYHYALMLGYTPADAYYLAMLGWRVISPDTALRLLWKGVIDWSTYTWICQMNHIDPQHAYLLWYDSTYVFSPGECADLLLKGYFSWDQYYAEMLKNGFTPEYAYMYFLTRQQLLPPEVIQEATNREYITEDVAWMKLLQLGYAPEDAWLILQLRWWYPPVSDIIRFAVREVFSPEIVEKYRTDEDFPAEFEYWARLAGLHPEFARWYWRAHWDLPSIEMGYEMLHRGVITREELETLLRTQDVMPYWRDKLIQISYRPYTRVDVRRMYQAGVLSVEDVFKSYLELGYDEEHAEKMTEWTIRSQMEDEKDLTKSELTSLYQEGAIDEDFLYTALREMGYSDMAAWWIVTLAMMRRNAEFVNAAKSIARRRYVAGIIDANQVWDILAGVGVPSQEIYRLLDIWTMEKETNIELPSKNDILDWYRFGLVTRGWAREWLVKLGVPEEFADLYLREVEVRYRKGT